MEIVQLLRNTILLARVKQWYKNLIFFIALIFSSSFLDVNLVLTSFAGFLVYCLISSSNYILNDMADRKNDRLNPQKRTRPIASGKVSTTTACLIFIVFFSLGIYVSYLLSYNFMLITLVFFINSTLYTFFMKNIMITDIVTVAINFLLRSIAGAILIEVFISHWLIIGVFFFALFLVLGKRYWGITYLNAKSPKYRPAFLNYSKTFILSWLKLIMAILIVTFTFYSLSSANPELILTLPLFIYLIFKYYYFIITNNKSIRNPENIFQNIPFLITALIFFMIVLILIML